MFIKYLLVIMYLMDSISAAKTKTKKGDKDSKDLGGCSNFDDTAISSDHLKQVGNKVWYPMMTTRLPENRKCERIGFNRTDDSLDWEIIQEAGDRITGKYRTDGRSKLTDAGGSNSITYFLGSDFNKTLATYSCKAYGDQAKELYTIYSTDRSLSVNMKELGKIVGNITLKNINFQDIEQSTCKSFAPIANKDFMFTEEDIYNVELSKLTGNWIQKATTQNTSESLYIKLTGKTAKDRLESYYYHSHNTLGSKTSFLPNSRVTVREGIGHPFKAYEYRLYFDSQYMIVFTVPLATGDSTPSPFLEVLVKEDNSRGGKGNKDKYDLITLYDILLNRIRSNARRLIESLIIDLNFKDDHNITSNALIPKAKIQFTEDELVPISFEKISNVYELRYSTDSFKIFDINVCLIAGKYLKTFSQKDKDLVRNVTDIHMPNSKRVFRITNNRYSEVSYLYSDENYLVTYETFNNEENLRLYTRQSVANDLNQYNQVIDKIKSSALEKLSDMKSKLRMHLDSQVETFI